jgi:hypothetical protein
MREIGTAGARLRASGDLGATLAAARWPPRPRRAPRNAIWFCNQHTDLARQFEHMETGAALEAIDAASGRKRRPGPSANGPAPSTE